MLKGELKRCHACNVEFYVTPSRLKKNKLHHCSKECSGKTNSEKYNKKIKTECGNCGKELFYKKSRFNNIRHPSCDRTCSAAIKSKLYSNGENPKSLKIPKEDRIFWTRYTNVKYRAESKGMEFSLTYLDIKELYYKQKGLCHYTNMPMSLTSSKVGFSEHEVFSVDRVDSSKGYTKDNIVLCLNIINRFKGNSELDYFKRIFRAIFEKEKHETKD